jgi:signal transduction histidine kinase
MPTRLLIHFLGMWLLATAVMAQSPTITIDRALTVSSDSAAFPSGVAASAVALPDDWSASRPGHDGVVWYRATFTLPERSSPDELWSLYIRRACSTVDVLLNGHRIHSTGPMREPLSRQCHRPQIVTLPSALLAGTGNVLELRVRGSDLARVAARSRSGGLSELQIGPQVEMTSLHAHRAFWSIQAVQITAITMVALGGFLLTLFWINRSETFLLYFGALLVGWALLSSRVWWSDWPLSTRSFEVLCASAFAPVAALAILFLLSYAGRASRRLMGALMLQCVLMPLSLTLLPPQNLYAGATSWFVLLGVEVAMAVAWWLRQTWSSRVADLWAMAATLATAIFLVFFELLVQFGAVPVGPIEPLNVLLPLLLLGIGARLLKGFARALQAAEISRSQLERRVMEATAEIERNFSQLSALRVEQVTENERKRIAADLHDDLGAKLLTIVHTSDNDRISTLAREALEEMRLSVRGLTGRPVHLADALADWRAETVSRLGQANIEAEWHSPADDVEQVLTARVFVQTTRILREAVSNIIKHSGATQCKIRTSVEEAQFALFVQDNGRGIPMELDGKLDRGHGMSGMKHRAKQLRGQCLVESGPGYGTVIRLTIPL